MVKVVATKAAFDAELAAAGSKAVVVDYFATWCGPCKVIAPYYEELSKQFTDVVFLKVRACGCAWEGGTKQVV
jgi:thioredoxin 1